MADLCWGWWYSKYCQVLRWWKAFSQYPVVSCGRHSSLSQLSINDIAGASQVMFLPTEAGLLHKLDIARLNHQLAISIGANTT